MKGRLRERGPQVWELSFDLGRDPRTGKRLRRFISFHGNRKQAEQALRDALYKHEHGIDIEPTRVSVPEYLERWLKDYAQNAVAPSTLVRYQVAVRKHLSAHLAGIKLSALRPMHVQSSHAACLAEGLSPRTVLQHHRILREALQHAVKWQLLAGNPASAVDPPRGQRTELQILSGEQVGTLLEASAESFIGPIVYLALQTGARSGELLALRWSDLDLDTRRLSIVRTVQRLPGQGLVFRPTKTHRSRRAVTLSAESVAFLREHLTRQKEMRLRLGAAFTDQGLVFPQPHGGPYEPGQVSKEFDRVLRQANLPDVRFHDLRHTSATLLLSANIHPKVVSERLGHASIHITLDTYSHVVPNLQDEAAEALDKALHTPSRAAI